MNFMRKIKVNSILFYSLLFFLFLTWNLILMPISFDEIWNYGFAHNIYNGLVPYRDFNMVLTPFYSFFMSLFLFLFGSSSLVMHVVNAVMLTICCYLLTKIIGEKTWIVVFFFFFFMQKIFPSYNIFLFVLFVLLLYMEKKKWNDYLIGVVLAIIVLTKQSVGVCMLVPSLFYLKNKEKLSKRIVGFLIPCLVFFIYLLCTGSFKQFLDLCLFGLFDFASTNGKLFNIYFVYVVIMVLIYIYFIIKKKYNINNYYGLAFMSITIPLFDNYHNAIAFYAFLVVILSNLELNFKIKLNGRLLIGVVLIGISIIVSSSIKWDHIKYPNNIKYFNYRLINNESIKLTNEVNKYIKNNKDKNFVFVDSNGYYFKIINDLSIGYIDLINDGNWGYNGKEKLLKKFKCLDNNTEFFVNISEKDEIYQTNKEVFSYVEKNGTKKNSVGLYDVYVIDKVMLNE